MNTVIVPVDFSETSRNSAIYATKLLTGHYGVEMILYHVYDKPSHAAEAEAQIEKLKSELMDVGIVKISTMVEEGKDLIHELETLARHRRADLIIMGITGRHALGKVFLGSNTLKIVEQKVCPVLIIPPNAQFKEIKNVMLASDFKEPVKSTPSVPVKKILKIFQPRLHIVNVDNKHYVSLTEEFQGAKAGLHEMFKEFNPEFYFLGMNDVDEAINQFAHDKNIDFITIVHREHSLLDRMFRTSHTKKLAYQSNIPVLAVHE